MVYESAYRRVEATVMSEHRQYHIFQLFCKSIKDVVGFSGIALRHMCIYTHRHTYLFSVISD